MTEWNEKTSDASREAYYAWDEEESPTSSVHHVVQGTKVSIEALEARFAADQEKIVRLKARVYREQERTADHESARQSHKERADYADQRVRELEAALDRRETGA